ncbi:MAG: M14 family zinc carboxypeptidase, partial [Xanthomonadales bacterium]|nr:M14 family zinc carboxypeptidase [Xanthomonadales bacterium]
RTYNGLHTRHQQLMADTDIIHGEVVGTTHHGNDIWAYRIGDGDRTTWEGMAEAATLTNGGIHAREWQTPEVVTGIMELFAERQGDDHYYDFLLENVNMVVIPVQNVDGFLQTQRYPSDNYLGTDPFDIPNDPVPAPRDGRMRRKNMLGVDTLLETEDDHLLGIDLNRNNPPLWATNPQRSSDDVRSLVFHGESGHSEPESQALLAAAALGPADQLRLYNDVHSFSQVFYFHRTQNIGLNNHVISLMFNQSNFNAALPNGSLYLFNADPNANIDAGFGMTNEYFTTQLEIPAYGIEVEPNQGGQAFPNDPGCGANYGGLARNCHDGFILPESQIRRVREELAQSIAANFYQQAGPPSISAVRFVDVATQAVVFEAEWDTVSATERQLYSNQVLPLQLGRNYTFWVAYDRPMRWRSGGTVVPFPGQPGSTLNVTGGTFVNGSQLSRTLSNQRWINTPGDAPNGYYRYQDDTFATEINFTRNTNNLGLVSPTASANVQNRASNLTGQAVDSDPSTPITWSGGGWAGWEGVSGTPGNTGGTDSNYFVEISSDPQPEPFVVEPGTSAAWYDISHDGEGFVIEILDGNRAVMYWFTYDESGEQAWYIAVGEVRGNRLLFPEVLRTSGGVFGPDFDPASVVTTVAGSATFLYEGCDSGTMVYRIDGRKGRFDLQRLSRILGVECGGDGAAPEEATRSGSWFNAAQDGHGFTIELLDNGQVLVYWFTYDLEGNQAWFFGVGTVEGDELVISQTLATRGPRFGPDFDPNDLELIEWGTLRFSLGCDSGSVDYDGSLAGFPAASLDLSRLSTLAGLSCAAAAAR